MGIGSVLKKEGRENMRIHDNDATTIRRDNDDDAQGRRRCPTTTTTRRALTEFDGTRGMGGRLRKEGGARIIGGGRFQWMKRPLLLVVASKKYEMPAVLP